MADPTLSGSSGVLYPPTANGGLSQAPLADAEGDTLVMGRAVAMGTSSVTDGSGNASNKHIAVVVGTGIPGPNTTIQSSGCSGQTCSVLAVVDLSQPYTYGQPFTPAMIGYLVLPTGGFDVALNGNIALVATGTNVLLINLANPSQPVVAGQVEGNFGLWLALSQPNTIFADTTGQATTTLSAVPTAELAYVSSYSPNPIPVTLPPTPNSQNPNFLALLSDVTLTQLVGPGDSAVTSGQVNIIDELGDVVASYTGPLSGGQGTVVWPKGSLVDTTHQYSAEVYAVKNGSPVATFPVPLSIAGPAITVTRVDLKTTSSVGTPTPANTPAFTYSATPTGGGLTAQYSTDDPNANPNAGNIQAPGNPTGKPSPGGLANLKVSYSTLAGARASKTFQVGTFGLSVYIIASAADHGSPATECDTLPLRHINYEGVTSNPIGLPPGNYCTSFLADTRLQGSGQLADGTKIHFEPSNGSNDPNDWTFSIITGDWRTRDNTVITFGTIATDPKIIPLGTSVELETRSFVAHDTGGAITGYRIDIFAGVGRAASAPYLGNPIEVAACTPATSACPGKEIK